MITKDQAVNTRSGQIFYHVTKRNRDGSAVRARINGKCHTWVTRPDDFKIPVKYGLKSCFYITPSNASEWSLTDPTEDAETESWDKGLTAVEQSGLLPRSAEIQRLSEEQARDLGERYMEQGALALTGLNTLAKHHPEFFNDDLEDNNA